MKQKDIASIVASQKEGDLLLLKYFIDVNSSHDQLKEIVFIAIIVNPHPVIYSQDATEMLSKLPIISEAQNRTAAKIESLKTVNIFFPDSLKYKQSSELIDFYWINIEKGRRSIREDDYNMYDYYRNLQDSFFVRGIFQVHYCLGLIPHPEEVLVKIYNFPAVKQCSLSAQTDSVIFDCIKSIFKELEQFFSIHQWEFNFSSPWDIHLALMAEEIKEFLELPFAPYDLEEIEAITSSKRKIQKKDTDFIKYMNGKRSDLDENQIFNELEKSLSGKIFIALRYYRNMTIVKNRYRDVVSLLKREFKDGHAAQKITGYSGRFFEVDPISHSLRPFKGI